MRTPFINKIILFLYALAALVVAGASLFSPQFRSISYAPLREILLPPPEPVIVEMLYSTEKRAWLENQLENFYATNPRQAGRPILIHLEPMGSREMILSVLEGSQPDIISPASSLQISILEDLSRAQSGVPIVNRRNPDLCRSVVTTPLVLIAWEERADVLFKNTSALASWSDLATAVVDPGGWANFDQPDWGYIKFSHTSPLSSNSGFMAILLMTYNYHNTTDGLTTSDILSDQGFQDWFLEFENAVSSFEYSTGPLMEKMIAYGPSSYDIAAVYEATAIEHIEHAVGKFGELHVFYPPATVWSDHPFCILDAGWVAAEEYSAARQFIEFLSSDDAVRSALLDHGFRPENSSIPLNTPGSPFVNYSGNGFKADISHIPEVEVPQGIVLNTLLEFWSRNLAR